MKITCISASNTKQKGTNSTSTKVCYLAKDLILTDNEGDIEVEVIPLMDYDITPCILCGDCYKSSKCLYDEDFNELLTKLQDSQAGFIVVPHYSPIPAKLIMVFEKINEILYASWINDSKYQSPLKNMPVGIIGHGGMTETNDSLKYYHDHLITPVATTLKSLSFKIIGLNERFPNGAVFGLKDDSCLRKVEGLVFPEIIQDWPKIEERIKPLIINVFKEINK